MAVAQIETDAEHSPRGAAERPATRLLVVEDDPRLSQAISGRLREDGHAVDCVSTIARAAAAVEKTRYDLVLLDLNLPDGDAVDLLKRWRRAQRSLPVIAVTARGGLDDKVRGLDAGADDYLSKPFEPDELLARVRALLRRPGGALGKNLTYVNIELDTVRRQLRIGGRRLNMPRRELAILELLMRRAETVVDRDAVMRAAYAPDEHVSSNVVEVNVSRLRRKLMEHHAAAEVHAIRGVGYMLCTSP